ncbi:MAG: DUF5711 family protein [Oscillospiraceae bacterium]
MSEMEEFEFYKDLQEETDERVEERELKSRLKKPARRPRKLLLAAVLIVVLAVVLVAAYRDGTGFDVLRRRIAAASLPENADGSRGSYSFESDRLNRFAPLEDGRLLVAGGKSIRILDGQGNEVYCREAYMENPVVSYGGGAAVVYDAGGDKLWWLDASGELAELSCTGILAATLNDEGWLAVTDQCSGYKGAVQVYNPSRQLVFTFYSSERFVTDACVLPGGKRLAAVTVGQSEGTFISNILIYRLDSTEAESALPLADAYVTHLGTVGQDLALAADTKLSFIDAKGAPVGSYDYSALFLRGCDFGGDGFAVLLLSRYKSGTLGAVTTVSPEGEVLSAKELDEEVLDISAAGKYVAVLFSDRVAVYTDEMELYAEWPAEHLRRIFLQKDGSVLAVSDSDARVIVP